MNDFTRLFNALEAVAAEASSVAEAIRNPSVDNNDQSTIDELASRLENVAETLHAATEAELAEDGTKPEGDGPGKTEGSADTLGDGQTAPAETSDPVMADTPEAPASDEPTA